MFLSLLGLLSFQAYWISTAYSQKRESIETEIKEAFSRANDGLLLKKLGDLSGVDISLTAQGTFARADSVLIEDLSPRFGTPVEPGFRHRWGSERQGKNGYRIDTIIHTIDGAVKEVSARLETSVFFTDGKMSERDFTFMDSLLRVYLRPIHFQNQYELTFGGVNDDIEFSAGEHSFSPDEDPIESIIQPIAFGSKEKMARLTFPKRHLVKSSLSSISLIIVASVVMLGLLISAWYYIVRSLQRQYQLTQMKDDFISNMTHELKTPVTASSLALQVLAKNDKVKSDAGLDSLISVAQSEQQRMLVMIENILDSTAHNGLANEEREVVSLNEELEALIESVSMKARERGGELKLELPDQDLKVLVSQIHLQNAIINLLENALKYNEGIPHIQVSLKQKGEYTMLKVSDNGIGIGKEEQKRIFEKFYRVSTGNVHTVKGYGLGLSYSRAVIEEMNGKISVQSEAGKGSTFIIELPIVHES